MKTESLDKLPKWAQSRISALERNLKDAQDKLGASQKLLEYEEPGLGYSEGVLTRRQIPHNHIAWVNKDRVRFNLSLTSEGYLEVNVSGYRGHPVVFPRSSNHIYIGVCPDAH